MIIWSEFNGEFVEEMVNKSEQNKITLAWWSSNDRYILIVLDEQEIILGTVEGERMWSVKTDLRIVFQSWIENDETIVAISKEGEIVAIEMKTAEIFGEFGILEENDASKGSDKKEHKFLNLGSEGEVCVFKSNNLDWDFARILIGFENGRIFVLRNIRECLIEEFQYNIDRLQGAAWSNKGDLFALGVVYAQKEYLYLIE